jgi:hypothetical protein
MHSMDGYGKPVRTIDPISALKEWLGMDFTDQRNAALLGLDSMSQGEQHSYDFSGPTQGNG